MGFEVAGGMSGRMGRSIVAVSIWDTAFARESVRRATDEPVTES